MADIVKVLSDSVSGSVLYDVGQQKILAQIKPGCEHTISFEFNIDSSEYVFNYYGGALFGDDRFNLYMDLMYNDTTVTVCVPHICFDIPLEGFFDTWHSVSVIVTEKAEEDGWLYSVTLDGESFGDTYDLGIVGVVLEYIDFGALFPDKAHRSLRNVHVVWAQQPPFTFPDDLFQELLGNATVVDGILRIDDDDPYGGGADGLDAGRVELDEDMSLCCARDITEISSITMSIDIEIISTGTLFAGGCGVWTASGSVSGTWNRINRKDAFNEEELQFKLYLRAPHGGSESGFKNRCVLVFEYSGVHPGTSGRGSYLGGAQCGPEDHTCEDGTSHRTFTYIWDIAGFSPSITNIDYELFTLGVVVGGFGEARPTCCCPINDCLDGYCDYATADVSDIQSASWTFEDFSSVLGTYEAENTNFFGPTQSAMAHATVTIA